MSRYFNITGPNKNSLNYSLDLLQRVDIKAIESYIDRGRSFTVLAPRQTGKTTFLLSLQQKLNEEGRYRCIYCDVEAAQVVGDDLRSGVRLILSRIAEQAEIEFHDLWPFQNFVSILERTGPEGALITFFERWRVQEQLSQPPFVLLLDGIDLLQGKMLANLLGQLRTGLVNSPFLFPQSVVLCGVRDVRDKEIKLEEGEDYLLCRSGVDVREKTVLLKSFTEQEVAELFAQHTAETGQVILPEAVARLYTLASGHPWLVNAILCEALYEMNIKEQITTETIESAKAHFMLRQDVYMNQLSQKLTKPSVRKALFPMLNGGIWKTRPLISDLEYLEDLELIRWQPSKGWGVSNPFYKEIIPMAVGRGLLEEIAYAVDRSHFVKNDGKLDFRKIIEVYQNLYCENFLLWGRRYDLEGVLAQLLLHSLFLHVVGDKGHVDCDYGLGTGCVDFCVEWNYVSAAGEKMQERFVVEIDLFDGTKAHSVAIRKWLAQFSAYALPRQPEAAYLIVLDLDSSKTWFDRLFREDHISNGQKIYVYGL